MTRWKLPEEFDWNRIPRVDPETEQSPDGEKDRGREEREEKEFSYPATEDTDQEGGEEPSSPAGAETKGESNPFSLALTNRIITVLQKQLADQQRSKTELRKRFAKFFSALLLVQYVYLAGIILLDAITPIPLDVSDGILQGVITSVFLQTLSAMGVMIAFAFAAKEETWIADMLRHIVQSQLKEPEEVREEREEMP